MIKIFTFKNPILQRRVILYLVSLLIAVICIILWRWTDYAQWGGPTPPPKEAMAASRAIGLCQAIYQYKQEFGAFPEIDSKLIEKLNGDNPEHAVFFYPGIIPMDKNGRFLDPSGKPYTIVITLTEIQVRNSDGTIIASIDGNSGYPIIDFPPFPPSDLPSPAKP